MKRLGRQDRVTQVACLLGMLTACTGWGQTGTSPAATAVSHNSSYIEPNGTARVWRIVPVSHAFWYNPKLPESIEANQAMAKFLSGHLR
ncbi:MAG TPA: hypothetical protein VE218_01060 [Acidobacteriaceae bacterium]|nr:hypothetical protein [Acidobacteriaceae bacterium]